MKKITTEEFIERAKKTHGDRYDYSLVDYKGSKEKVKIICSIHGEFEQQAYDHLNKRGCPVCGHNKKLDNATFIKRAIEKHGNKYDYSLIKYNGYDNKIKIICPVHGEFFQTPHEHLKGSGCYKCGNLKKGLSNTVEEFIEKVKKIHGDKYDYYSVRYINNKTKVVLICKTHGEFEVRPDVFLARSQDCPKCSNSGISKGEKKVAEFIKSIYDGEVLENKRDVIPPYEVDIYLPEKKLAFEYHGLYWHSQQQLEKSNRNAKMYHLEKLMLAYKNNVRLIQVFEDEWNNKQEVVKSRIKHILGIYDKKIGARQIEIRNIDPKTKNDFLNNYHIQGKDNASFKYGAFFNDELVGVMTFCAPRVSLGRKEKKAGEYELSRFATKAGYKIQGLASKMFKHFINTENVNSVYTYSDIRWNLLHGHGTVYEKIGMNFISISDPNYYYIINNERKHRFGFRKQELPKRLIFFNEELTEYKNMLYNGIDRVFDCGNEKYIWKIEG